MLRVGVDIGGTFTDFVLLNDETGQIFTEKCLTTPREPDKAIFQGLGNLESNALAETRFSGEVVHATTLITNAIIEGRGAKTGLITTKGFRDILEMARETRYDVYDLSLEFPKPVVPRHLRLTVDERTLSDGSIRKGVDPDEVAEVLSVFVEQGVRSVAVMFLHSFKNPENELEVRRIISELHPEMTVSLSHEVIAQPKEYERLSTTVLDAYVKPITEAYVKRLQVGLRDSERSEDVFMMLSNGGISPIDLACEFPIQLVESGPAAGVSAARHFGRQLSLPRVLAFDMGGTTAKLCLIKDGRVNRTREFEVARLQRFRSGSGYPLAVPVYHLLEIGAGGGSIARVNDLGLLAVGPRSAGSEPGPACYGLGGTEPTVTDADLLLGFLDENSFLGGEFKLDKAAARHAVESRLAACLGLPVEQATWGIFDIVTETMAAAARLHLAEQGEDPSLCSIVASGGAGPVHAVALAKRLGSPRVIIPPIPGVLSAFGLLAAPPSFEMTRSISAPATQDAADRVEEALGKLAVETLRLGRITGAHRVDRYLELRHRGQESAVEVDVTGDWSDQKTRQHALTQFADEYERLFGRRGDTVPLEISNLRIAITKERAEIQPHFAASVPLAAGETQRPVYFHAAEATATRVRQRSALRIGDVFAGPLIVEERESTTVIWPGDEVAVDASGSLVITVSGASR